MTAYDDLKAALNKLCTDINADYAEVYKAFNALPVPVPTPIPVPPPLPGYAFRPANGKPLRGVCAYRPGGHPDWQNDASGKPIWNATPYDVFGNVDTQIPTARRAMIKSSGFNHIRAAYNLGPVMAFLEAGNQSGADALYKKILDDVTLYVQSGLMVIIDNHWSNLGQDNVLGYTCRDCTGSQAKIDTYRKAITQLGAALHARTATLTPQMVALELCNEPPNPAYITVAPWAQQQEATRASVRAVMSRHTIVLTPQNFARIEELPNIIVPNDKNVIYTLHPYDVLDKATLKAKWFDPAKAWAQNHGIEMGQIWYGEFNPSNGATDPAGMAFNGNVANLAEAQGSGWCIYALNTGDQSLCDEYPPNKPGNFLPGVLANMPLS